jgi:Mysoin-binding motif of peroxisomes
MRLRRVVSESLSAVLERYIQAQHTIGLLTDPSNLEKYYDIYELSMEELAEARSASLEATVEDQYSLKCLRILFSRLYTVRKSILCCLLAIKADGCGSDIPPWTSAADEMRELATVTGEAANKIANILNEKDRK